MNKRQTTTITLLLILSIVLTSCANDNYIPITRTTINSSNTTINVTNNITTVTVEHDHNQNLNTSNEPDFEGIEIGKGVYYTLCGNPWCTPSQTYFESSPVNKYTYRLTYKGSDNDGNGFDTDDAIVTQYIEFDTENNEICFFDGNSVKCSEDIGSYPAFGWGAWTQSPSTHNLDINGKEIQDADIQSSTLTFDDSTHIMQFNTGGGSFGLKTNYDSLNWTNSAGETICGLNYEGFDCINFGFGDLSGETQVFLQSSAANDELEVNISNDVPCTFNGSGIVCDAFYGDGSTLTGISGGGNPFNQWVNSTSNYSADVFTLNNSFQKSVGYAVAHIIENNGTANTVQTHSGCQYEGTANEILCGFGSVFWGVPQIVNVTGNSNSVSLVLASGIEYENNVAGNANTLLGTNTVADTNIDGNGNLMLGTGGFDVDSDSKGNIGVGNSHEFIGASGSGAFGQGHDITADYCNAFGAVNDCNAAYGTAMGYDCNVNGGTGVCVGRDSDQDGVYGGLIGYQLNVTGSRTYGLGNNYDCIGNDLFCIGNQNPSIVINKTDILMNKTTDYLSGITTLANIPHAEVWNVTNNGYTITISALDTWYDFTGLQMGETQDFTIDGGIIPDYDGTYKIDWSVSFSGTGGSTHAVSLLIDGTEHSPCRSYRKLGTAGDVGNMGGTCIITASAGDNITGAVMDINAPAQNINVWSMNTNIMRLGD